VISLQQYGNDIFPVHIFISFIHNNKHLFDTNNEIYKHKTRSNNLHLPVANLSKFNKGAYTGISGMKVFNHLPQYTKDLIGNQTNFKSALKRFL
jgi:hypothetical protein